MRWIVESKAVARTCGGGDLDEYPAMCPKFLPARPERLETVTYCRREMKNWRAVSIGVQKAGEMAKLPGAVNGAKQFATWAEAQGYRPRLFTDEKGPLTFAQIRGAISEIIEECPDRLLVYFAGHGLQRADGPVWLLSNWEEDEAETVNVEQSLRNASRTGIPAIGIFADACRNVTGGAMNLTPRSIFPSREQIKNPMVAQTQRDIFFACRFDEISQETKSPDPNAAYGVFSKYLIRALEGKEPQAIDTEGSKAVTSQSLADFLEKAVARASELLQGADVQIPECVSGFRPPKNIYNPGPFSPAPDQEIAVEIAVDERVGTSPMIPSEYVTASLAIVLMYQEAWRQLRQIIRSDITKTLGKNVVEVREALDQLAAKSAEKAEAQLDALTSKFAAIKGRVSFETRQGFTVVGDTPVEAFISASGKVLQHDIFIENEAFQVRATQDTAPRSIAIRMRSGNWFAGVLLPGFVGALLFANGAAESLSYKPARSGSFDEGPDEKYGEEVARWTALATQGRFPNGAEIAATTNAVRRYKSINPSMGCLAAYAYDRMGEIDQISGIASYFAGKGQPVPFDIALLSEEDIHVSAMKKLEIETTPPANQLHPGQKRIAPIAGSHPLLTRGWSRLDHETVGISPELFELKKHLVPSLWTTLSPDGGTKLAELLMKGDL
jgi:uncharacterized caspase-like protein